MTLTERRIFEMCKPITVTAIAGMAECARAHRSVCILYRFTLLFIVYGRMCACVTVRMPCG